MLFKDTKVDFNIDIDEWKVEGYASVFGNKDSMDEIINKGAFAKTIKERFPKNLIKAFWRHRDPFGICKHIEEDSTGLLTVSIVSKTSANKDNMILIQDKAVDRMSIGYDVIKFEKDNDEDLRYLTELRLYEYSPVPIAANEETSILGAKSPMEVYSLLQAFEKEYLAGGKEGLKISKKVESEIVKKMRSVMTAMQEIIDLSKPKVEKDTEVLEEILNEMKEYNAL